MAQLLRTVLQTKPANATHWTVRSTAPFFVEKVRDVVGLYLPT